MSKIRFNDDQVDVYADDEHLMSLTRYDRGSVLPALRSNVSRLLDGNLDSVIIQNKGGKTYRLALVEVAAPGGS